MEEGTEVDITENKGVVEEIKIKDIGGRDYFLPISILAAGIMISGSIIYLVGAKNQPNPSGGNVAVNNPTPPGAAAPSPQLSGRDVVLGNPNAPVTLIEYGDYQCPFCARFFSDAEFGIKDQYVKTNKVKMVFKNFAFIDRFPGLPAGANESHDSAAAADCAGDQGKFWAYHDALFQAKIGDTGKGGTENDGFFNRALFLKLAEGLALDMNALTSCIDSGKHKAQIDKDTSDAQAAGVNSTPTVFINGKLVQPPGALPFAQFQTAIEAALNSK